MRRAPKIRNDLSMKPEERTAKFAKESEKYFKEVDDDIDTLKEQLIDALNRIAVLEGT